MQSVHRHFQKQFTRVYHIAQQFHDSHEKCCDAVLQFVQLISKWDTIQPLQRWFDAGLTNERFNNSNESNCKRRTEYNIFRSTHLQNTLHLIQGCYMDQLETLLQNVKSIIVDEWGQLCDQLERLLCETETHYMRQHGNMQQWFKRDDKHWINVQGFLHALRETTLSLKRERQCKTQLLQCTLEKYAHSDADRRRLMIRSTSDVSEQTDEVEEEEWGVRGEGENGESADVDVDSLVLLSPSKTIRSARELGPWSGFEVYSLFCECEYVNLDTIMASVQRADDLVSEDMSETHRSLIDLRTSPTSKSKQHASISKDRRSPSSLQIKKPK